MFIIYYLLFIIFIYYFYLFIITVAYMLWQQLPGILSGFASAMANVGAAGLQDLCQLLILFSCLAGGYGKKLKRLSGGNKWNSAPAAYDEYDYYTSGTEHYVSFCEI